MRISGAYTALITPFNNEGNVDYEQLKRNIEFQIENGINGILALGTTAETPTLTESEKFEIIKVCFEKINKRVPLMIGTGTNSTLKTIENTKYAEEVGADIALIVAPYYNKPTQEGIFRHFEAISNETNIPILVYNIKGRTGINIETETLNRISKLDNVIGVKEASGDLNQIQEVINKIHSKSDNFNLMSGDDSFTLPILSLGGNGVVSVISNLYPKEMSDLVRNYLSGNVEEVLKIHNKMLPIMKGAFIETNPAPIKEAMKVFKMDTGKVRLPLVEMKNENKNIIREIVSL